MERVGEKKRKERVDKKRDIRPTVNPELYEFVAKLSYITNKPMKDVIEQITMRALKSRQVMEFVSKFFRREFFWEDRILYRGIAGRDPYKYPFQTQVKRLPTTRYRREQYDCIQDIAYALDTSNSQAATLLLETAIHQTQIVNQYIAFYVEVELLDAKRMKQLKEIIDYLNRKSKEEEKITLPMLLGYLKDELFDRGKSFATTFIEWIDRNNPDGE